MAKKRYYSPDMARKEKEILRSLNQLGTKLEKENQDAKRDCEITIQCSKTEKEVIESYVKVLGRNMSDLARELLFSDMDEFESLLVYSEYHRRRR